VRRAGKRMLVFSDSDSAEPVDLDGCLVFRTSLYRSTRAPNEHALPHLGPDLVRQYLGGEMIVRPKAPLPIAGFRGRSPPQRWSIKHGIKLAIRRARHGPRGEPRSWRTAFAFARIRNRALRAVETTPEIRSRIFRHPGFLGGAQAHDGTVDFPRFVRERAEFVRNLVECDYGVCVRGEGNYSMRLYETVCLGRIPLFIDTDCVLPLEDVVDRRSHVVWVDWRDARKAGTTLREFHDEISAREFEERQRRLRSLWLEYLSPEAFFGHLLRYL